MGRQYPSPSQVYLVGLCTGTLAAAAISSSTSLSELLPAAVHTVQVAFRLGLCGQELRARIYTPDPSAGQEWSAVFFGLEEASAVASIDEFSESKVLPVPPSKLAPLSDLSTGTAEHCPSMDRRNSAQGNYYQRSSTCAAVAPKRKLIIRVEI